MTQRFCSNDCRFKSQIKPRNLTNCQICGKSIEYQDHQKTRQFCSRRCQAQAWVSKRGQQSSSVIKGSCDRCGCSFTYVKKPSSKNPQRFCSKKCAQLTIAPGNRGVSAYRRRLIDKGLPIAEVDKLVEAYRQKLSRATQRNVGKSHSADTKKKISDKIKIAHAEGRSGGLNRKNAPSFNGTKLRSKLELAAITYLTREYDYVLGETLFYEHRSCKVKYVDQSGQSHTYTPDFYDPVNQIVIEVKPSYQVKKPSGVMELKKSAIGVAGFNFCYLTDKDIPRDILKEVYRKQTL